jgi:hypothetical protein
MPPKKLSHSSGLIQAWTAELGRRVRDYGRNVGLCCSWTEWRRDPLGNKEDLGSAAAYSKHTLIRQSMMNTHRFAPQAFVFATERSSDDIFLASSTEEKEEKIGSVFDGCAKIDQRTNEIRPSQNMIH